MSKSKAWCGQHMPIDLPDAMAGGRVLGSVCGLLAEGATTARLVGGELSGLPVSSMRACGAGMVIGRVRFG